jgi:hypothetical protein
VTILDDLTVALAATALLVTAIATLRGFQPSSTARSRVVGTLRKNWPPLDDLFRALERRPPKVGNLVLSIALVLVVATAGILRYTNKPPGTQLGLEMLTLVTIGGLYVLILTPTAGSPGRLSEAPVSDVEIARVAKFSALRGAVLFWILFAVLGVVYYLIGTITSFAQFVQVFSEPRNLSGVAFVIGEMVVVGIYGGRKVNRMVAPALERNVRALEIRVRVHTSDHHRADPLIVEGLVTGISDVLRIEMDQGWVTELQWGAVRRLELRAGSKSPDPSRKPIRGST